MSDQGREQHPRKDTPPIGLDELSALCDQMLALSRAGIPLDQGLLQLAHDLPENLAHQARDIGQQLESGRNLADIVAASTGAFPAVYASVIDAGIRSGRLTVALEGFARLARQLAEVRRLVLTSLVYPLMLLILLLVISVEMVRRVGPAIRDALLDLRPRRAERDWISVLLDWSAVCSQWFWIVPLLALVLGLFWFVTTRQATASGKRSHWMDWVPGAGRLLRNSQLLTFSQVLGLLTKQQVPLPQALRLAGNASGDTGLAQDAATLATQLERGDAGRSSLELENRDGASRVRSIPPFIRWNLLHADQTGRLEHSLQRSAETYRRRTRHAANWLRKSLPIIFSLSLGGCVALLYAAVVLVPWFMMMRALSVAMELM